ncbi:MAG: aliphatic sulfonate ABC transporter permease SsuC [Burkholderiales bacterium]|nr:aliphatic sulfonate ABC transporter permease SsuC [Burkholderiales bacterium]
MSSTISHNIHQQASRSLPQESELQVTPFPHAFAEALEAPDAQAPSRHLAQLRAFAASVGQGLLPWLVPITLIVVWQVASSLGWLSTRVLPAPVDVVKAAWTLTLSGELFTHVKVSAGRALTGLAIGGGLGLLLGLLTGSVKFFETLLDSSIQMVRNIPALALIPLVILWFGIDEMAKLFLIAVSVFFPIYLNTFHGIRNVDPQLIEMGRTYGLSRWQLYRDVVLPGALSSILVGLRFSLGLMWVILIVAETISAQSGIGYLTMNAREFLQTDIVLVGILLYALLGKLADLFARGLERWWLRWHPGYQ